ncbi:MAG: accessory gene regulator B family protein [Bacillota bacterium]|nr:accessory gene regulator B family protein [Bacillota bacterium]
MYLTERIAAVIGKQARLVLKADENSEKIIVYGAVGLLQIIGSILWTVIAGMIFGLVYEVLLFSIAVSVLRKYSGGAHASSPGRCIVVGVTVSTAVSLLIKHILCRQSFIFGVISAILCIFTASLITVKLAPVDSENKPIISPDMRSRLNHASRIVIGLFSIIIIVTLLSFKASGNLYFLKASYCIALAALWQSVTLIGFGIKVLNKVDHILKF